VSAAATLTKNSPTIMVAKKRFTLGIPPSLKPILQSLPLSQAELLTPILPHWMFDERVMVA
jgi:hypothetical protein